MPELGFAEFTDPFIFDQMYLGGTWVPQRPVHEEPAPGCWALPTLAGTHIFQRPYRGDTKPADYRKLSFSFVVDAERDAAWRAVHLLKARCAPFYFSTGIRRTDVFAATSGTVYDLTSPLAAGIVPGVTSVTHPTRVTLNGVDSPSSATVSGQTATANDTGEIGVEYTSVHLVYFSQFALVVNEHNAASLAITLEEILPD